MRRIHGVTAMVAAALALRIVRRLLARRRATPPGHPGRIVPGHDGPPRPGRVKRPPGGVAE